MENLNEAAMRINAFLAEVEEPVRAIIPQVTRTVKAADEITSMMEGPVRATAPQDRADRRDARLARLHCAARTSSAS